MITLRTFLADLLLALSLWIRPGQDCIADTDWNPDDRNNSQS